MKIDLFTYKPQTQYTNRPDMQSRPDFQAIPRLKQPLNADTVSFGDDYGYELLSKKIPHLHCAYCGREMMTDDEIHEFCITVPELKGDKAIDEISKYTKELKQNSIPKKVSLILTNELKNNPDKTVRECTRKLVDEYETPILQIQVEHYKNIINNAQTLPEKYKKEITKLVPEPDVEALKKLPASNNFILKRKSLINGLQKIYKEEQNAEIKQQLKIMMVEANKIPAAKSDVGAYIVKYGNQSTGSFLKYLLMPLRSTADHVYLNKKEHTDNEFDLIAACSDCNNWERGDIPPKEWMARDDRHVTNFANQIKELAQVYAETKDENILNYIGNITITMTNALLGKDFKILDEKLKPDVKND